MSSRLTRVQMDVLDRMRKRWVLHSLLGCYELRKHGEPSRHVAEVTGESLLGRGLITFGDVPGVMVLTESGERAA